jgi:hypothetical protein
MMRQGESRTALQASQAASRDRIVRTDGAEQVRRRDAQVLGGRRPAAAPRPAAGARIFLAESHPVLEPHLDRVLARACSPSAPARRGKFLNAQTPL